MKIEFRIPSDLLDDMRQDLQRTHAFALERVEFLTAGATSLGNNLLLLARSYLPVSDDDYERDSSAGATIGGDAMRKALRSAYSPRAALLHVHSHGGKGQPEFSRTDLRSGSEFVPGFFHTVPRMPHGMLVLSNNSLTGTLWLSEGADGLYINEFVCVGAGQRRLERRI